MMHGLEVEEIIDHRQDFKDVVVGEILSIRPHPNAEKLRLATVRLSTKGEPQEIVCGAPNIAVGQKVPAALLGAKLPNGLTIAARPIRGIVSSGMICAADELGLGHDHSGIMVLDHKLVVGTPLVDALGFTEVMLDIAIPANRADLMSVRGLAREVAAILGTSAKLPLVKHVPSSIAPSMKVSVADSEACPQYLGRVISGVEIQESPDWLKQRLLASGMRPINSIVDATNYIMLLFGQPMHAFDADTLHDEVAVRFAHANEKLMTLDGEERTLTSSMVVIADAKGPVALAGVMGGLYTEVKKTTTDIFLESARFNPVLVRRAVRAFGLQSEASKRFEKGTWPTLPLVALEALTKLIVELSGGKPERIITVAAPMKKKSAIHFDPAMVVDRIGMPLSSGTVKTTLTNLGFGVTGSKTWSVKVPDWRTDVRLPEDVIDEVGRIIGYAEVPSSLPLVATVPGPLPAQMHLRHAVSDALVSLGFTETITHAYYGEGWKKEIGGEHIEIANPLDSSQQYLRRSLVPQLHAVLKTAVDRGEDARVFQIGRIFDPALSQKFEEQQPWHVTIGIAFKAPKGYILGRRLHGLCHAMLEKVGGEIRSLDVQVDTTSFRGRVVEWASVPLSQIQLVPRNISYTFLNEQPAVTRDISIILPTTMTYDMFLKKSVLQLPVPHVVELAQAMGADDGRLLTVRVTFRHPERTLTKDEVDTYERKIRSTWQQAGVTVR